MRSLFARIPWRGSLPFIIACAVVLLSLFAVKEAMGGTGSAEKRLKRLQEKSRAGGGNVAPEAYVPIWLYKGLKANLVLVGALLLASPWLGKRRSPEMEFMPPLETKPVGRWEVIVCVALMGVAAWHNYPRLFHSMWGDEEFNASRFILDRVERQPDGSLKVTPREWTTTLWNMRKPTNHLGYSVFARLTHDTFFQKSTEPTAAWFSEALLRTPVFVAGLLLIPAFLWALRVWGIRAWWGLLLLLLHPWYTRFGVDGRGYGFIMLGAVLTLGVLGRALQSGRWLWWALFGLGNFFIIWCNLQGAYPAVALNLTAAVCLWELGLKNPSTWLLARRWFVANMITLVMVVGWLAPCWPQLQEFMAKGEIHGTLDARFWRDGLSAWLFGQPYEPWEEPDNPYRYALQISLQTLPVLQLVGIALILALLTLGVVALLRQRFRRALVLFALGAPVVMLLHMYLGQNRPYDWYFSPFVPGLFLLAAAGADSLVGYDSSRSTMPRALAQAGLAMTVLLFAFITRQPRSLLRDHAIEPTREAVAAYRTNINPLNPAIDEGVMSGAFRMYTEGYDPAEYRFDTVEELQKLMAEADRSARAFYINVGFFRYLQSQPSTKPICDMLTDPAIFELQSVHYGLLHPTTRHVFRYKGKAP